VWETTHTYLFIKILKRIFFMTDAEKKKALDESIAYFEELINIVLPQGIEGVQPMELMRHYNNIRNELSKLYVDID
jgi:hypothetical protein